MAALVYRFASRRNVTGTLIRWYTWSAWSHTEFLLPGGLFGARMGTGVGYAPLGYDRDILIDEWYGHLPMTDDQYALALAFLLAQEGKGYDIRGDLGFAFREDWVTPDAWFCSRLGYAVPAKAGVNLLRLDRDFKVSPSDLYRCQMILPGRDG